VGKNAQRPNDKKKQNETLWFYVVYLCYSLEQRNWKLLANSKLANAPENTQLEMQYSMGRRQTKHSNSKKIYILLF